MTVVGNSPSTVPAQTVEPLQALLADVQRVRQRSLWICKHLERRFRENDARCEPSEVASRSYQLVL